MRIAAALILAALLAAPAMAAERRQISPIALQGTWLGQTGAMPAGCEADGYWIGFNTYDGKSFLMAVSRRVNGVTPPQDQAKGTDLMVVPPPPNTPTRIDVFLAGKETEIGVAIRTGSAMELIPAGPDKAYAATSLYLMRCF